MRYVLTFIETDAYITSLEEMGELERQAAGEAVERWFAENASRIAHHTYMAPPHTAVTLRREPGKEPVAGAGPFTGGGEVVAGFAEVEALDLDDALELAASWPAGPVVEVRPVS